MASQAISGIGTVFERHDGSSFEPVAEVFNISGPSMNRETIEVTTYDSVSGYREKIGGLRDAGQLTFTLNFRRDTYLLFKEDFEDEDPRQYRVILPDSQETSLTMLGLVTDLPLTIPEGDRITVDVTIEISGTVSIGSES
ncbi:MAG TPA: phage tail tube protein [Cyclobacteriaceae bacterium]|nr:phage tail tube protein [Cyclobacteriaceae bacterium]